MSNMMYRQGDLLFLKCDETDVSGEETEDPVLAHGEVTGHKHQVSAGQIRHQVSDRLHYLTVQSATATVTHEEHGPIVLDKGCWKVVRQREYEPNGWRTVAD